MPVPDKKGRLITIIRTAIADPKKHNIADLMKNNYLHMETSLLSQDRGVIAGEVVILDVKGTTLDHMTQMTPSMAKKSIVTYQVDP